MQTEAQWAVQVYRAALHALPASVRIWFGDLRDKGMASAFEVREAAVGEPAAAQRAVSRNV